MFGAGFATLIFLFYLLLLILAIVLVVQLIRLVAVLTALLQQRVAAEARRVSRRGSRIAADDLLIDETGI